MLNANYVLARLKDAYDLPFDRLCMHEFVLSARTLKREHGCTALDVAKRLMDYGFHPPTIYFPLIVPEALMVEPTETETKETLDAFCDAMLAIAREAAEEPELLKEAPHHRPVERLDEVRAAKQPGRQVRLRGAPAAGRRAGAGCDAVSERGLTRGAAASWPHAASMSRPRVRRTVTGTRARSSSCGRPRSGRGTSLRTDPSGCTGSG